MYCVYEQRNLRNGPCSTCWRNVCLYNGIDARSAGYTENVCLCKKHHGEKTRENSRNCYFPLKSQSQCVGGIVPCPQRLFPVFDGCLATGFTPGTFICRKHLKSAEEDNEICSKENYTPPKKVNKLNCFSLSVFPLFFRGRITHKFNLQVFALSGIALIHVLW